MKTIRSSLLGSSIVVAGLSVCATTAVADLGDISVNSYSPGTIDVSSDGNVYTGPAIALVSLNAQLGVYLSAGDSGRVKSWKAWVKVKRESGAWIQFSNDFDSASYSIPRPKTVNTVALVKVPFGTISPFATDQCNGLANGLRSAGLTNSQIFAQDRLLTFAIDGALSYEMSGIPGSSAPPEVAPPFSSMKKFYIKCKAAPAPPPSNPTRTVPDIEQVNLSVRGTSLINGVCKLNLSGVIVGKSANQQVKFRYKDDKGHQSNIHTVMTDHSKTAMFAHKYDLVGTGPKHGKIHIDIEGENFNSAWKNYNVQCQANAPGGVTTGQPSGGARGSAIGGGKASPTRPDPLPSAPARINVIPVKPALKKAN